MGKKSLIKSTSPKKAAAKDKETAQGKQGSAQAKKPAPPKGPVDIKTLLFKSFEPLQWPAPFVPPAAVTRPSGPAETADSPAGGIDPILQRRFSMAELITAAEKAEAERIAAQKAETERIAAQKAEAERIAAQKAEAERIAAQKAEAERIAAQKAEAERIAAQKAEAERIAAQKAEAERIAAQKAEAERIAAQKAEAERIAAEKAEAERIAAQKAEAERIAAQKAEAEKVTVTYAPAKKPSRSWLPADLSIPWPLVGLGAAVIFVFLMIIGASFSNKDNFYLKAHPKGIEIWQGSFAPIGQKQLMVLDGVNIPEPIKKLYTKAEIHPLIYGYYVGKANALLDARTPNIEQVKGFLHKAAAYAVTPVLGRDIDYRINHIDLLLLLYKADVAARNGTTEDLKAALNYLDEAALLKLDDTQYALVAQRTAMVKNRLSQAGQTDRSDTAQPAN